MDNIKNVIEKTDAEISELETELIHKVNLAYAKAVKAAQKEFKALELLNPGIKVSNAEVQRILVKTLDAFEKEYMVLVKPIQEATRKSYELGIKETSQFIKLIKEK